MTPKKTSQNGINFIKSHEGLRLEAYRDIGGVLTIGYGHTAGVKEDDVITRAKAEQFLKEDLRTAEKEVARHGLNINQNQFDALASFTFNLGAGAFQGSTLLKRIKENPDDKDIRRQFERWIHVKGKPVAGLVRRRKEEADLYFTKS